MRGNIFAAAMLAMVGALEVERDDKPHRRPAMEEQRKSAGYRQIRKPGIGRVKVRRRASR